MGKGRTKKILASILITAFVVLFASSPAVQALDFTCNDEFFAYLIVSGSPDIVKLGEIVQVVVTGKLTGLFNVSATLHIALFVDTATNPREVIAQGDLFLPADASESNATFSVAIPTNAISNTYLTASVTETFRSYSQIHISLIQNPPYDELRSQVQSLQAQNNDLQASNSFISTVLYIAVFVAAMFIAATGYILFLTFKAKKKKETQTTLS
jgi:hypothetical protein